MKIIDHLYYYFIAIQKQISEYVEEYQLGAYFKFETMYNNAHKYTLTYVV